MSETLNDEDREAHALAWLGEGDRPRWDFDTSGEVDLARLLASYAGATLDALTEARRDLAGVQRLEQIARENVEGAREENARLQRTIDSVYRALGGSDAGATLPDAVARLRERLAILEGTHGEYNVRRVDDSDFPEMNEDDEPQMEWVVELVNESERMTLCQDGDWSESVSTLFPTASDAFAALEKAR